MTQHQVTTNDSTHHTLYDLIGGETGVKNLVEVFYDIIETRPEAHKLNLLHLRGNGVAHARVEQFNFLCGFLGGPKLYVEKHGHSNIRTMHDYIEINTESKDIWLQCMTLAIDTVDMDAGIKDKLMNHFTSVAERLVNQAE
ncbi:MAG: hypothetical protein RIS87_345 [Pseudomonadota bacterium]